jgi:uncharacterized protein involved in exopolysaccharide biosynthesis
MQTNETLQHTSVIWSWIALLRRRWLAGALVFASVLALAVTMVWTARPIYRADAKIRIGEPPPTTPVGSGSSSTLLGLMRLGGDPFANDMELLGSRTVNEAIVRDVVLTMNVIAPAGWYRDSLFSRVSTADSTIKGLFEGRWLADGRIEVKQKAPRKRELGTFAPGTPVSLGGVTVAFKPKHKRGPEHIRISTVPFGEAVRRTSTRVGAARKRRDANVAEIRYTDPDPGVGRAVVASALRHFIELRTQIARRESGQNVDSLRVVARQTLAELTRAEGALERHERTSRLFDPSTQNEAFVLRYSEVAGQLEMVRAQLEGLSAVLKRAEDAQSPAERWTKLLSFEPFFGNETIGALMTQMNALEARRAELAPRRTESNREYATVLDQIAYIDRSLSAVARDIETGLREQRDRLEVQLQNMDAALAALPANAIELGRRQRNARVLSDVLILTEQRLRQEELRQALSFSNIQVIDPPALRYKAVWPRKRLGLAVGLLLAGLSSVLGMALLEQADRRVRRADDVMRLTSAPVLGVAIRHASAVRLGASEIRALVHHASANGRGPLRVLLAPVGSTRADDLASSVQAAFPQSVVPSGPLEEPEVQQARNITDFASASAAAGGAVPVTLVVEAGRTTRGELQRAAALIRQAGGSVGGVVIVVRGERAAEEVWE